MIIRFTNKNHFLNNIEDIFFVDIFGQSFVQDYREGCTEQYDTEL